MVIAFRWLEKRLAPQMDKMLYMITDFEEYTRQSDPHKCEKGYTWQTAIGLQAVDDLKNRHLHMWVESQSVTEDASKCNTCTLNCTLEELALLNFVKEKPNAAEFMQRCPSFYGG